MSPLVEFFVGYPLLRTVFVDRVAAPESFGTNFQLFRGGGQSAKAHHVDLIDNAPFGVYAVGVAVP